MKNLCRVATPILLAIDARSNTNGHRLAECGAVRLGRIRYSATARLPFAWREALSPGCLCQRFLFAIL